MGFNFPAGPVVDQIFGNYKWDGEKWVGVGLASFSDAPSDGNLRGRKDAAWEVIQKKNYIINGAMQVSQENGTTAGTASGYYPVDQWAIAFGMGGTLSIAQVVSITPGNSPNRIRTTVTSADAAVAIADYVNISQKIEGLRFADLRYGSVSAKAATLRFGVRAPAGTYSVGLFNAAANRSYVAEYVISGGEANTDVVKSITIPGDQSGSWLTDNGIGVSIIWTLMAGTNFQQAAGAWTALASFASTNQFNFMGTNANVFELFDVGLYVGSVAPPYIVPDYIDELMLCERYYERIGGGIAGPLASGFTYGSTIALAPVPFRAVKRTTPTFIAAGVAADYSVYRNGANNPIDTLPTMDAASQYVAQIRHTHSTAPFVAGQGVNFMAVNANAGYKFSARM